MISVVIISLYFPIVFNVLFVLAGKLLLVVSVSSYVVFCAEPAISHDSNHVSLVQWTNLFASCHKGHRFKSPGGTYVKPGFSC